MRTMLKKKKKKIREIIGIDPYQKTITCLHFVGAVTGLPLLVEVINNQLGH